MSIDTKVTAVATVEEDSRLPLWLLANAKAAATHNCVLPDAAEWEGFVALTAVCTAAEAIVNRLLEPLVTTAEWDGSGKKSLERKSVVEKWIKLSTLLRTTPPFNAGSEPIQSFAKVVEARNSLVHFKHGKNVRVFESEMKFRLGHRIPSPEEVAKRPPRKILQEGVVEPTLAPTNGPTYFAAFERVLLPILERCAGTPLNDVANRIRRSLELADSAIQERRNPIP
ncbi:hypothetical protein [Anaeromyxobacter sp. SG64]|uniref:hypothetical protein n=1 Tax=Anaeromyxobacter sp. SG64 TaxID=2925409 RepID=UPI001F58C4BC|nr:hypothetical protein [Anaeromyxobacter sp. SG64]